jgi:hypothetical protein
MRDANPRDLCDLGGWASYHVPFKHYIQPDIEVQRGAFAKRRELNGNSASEALGALRLAASASVGLPKESPHRPPPRSRRRSPTPSGRT